MRTPSKETDPSAVVLQTEAAVHSAYILNAIVALGISHRKLTHKRNHATIAQLAYATGLTERVVKRVVVAPEFMQELETLRETLRENPLLDAIQQELGPLAVRGVKEIKDLLSDEKVSRSKKVETAFKLLGLIGLGGNVPNPVANLINVDAVNILQVNGEMSVEEVAVLEKLRDRALGKGMTPVLDMVP